MKQFPRCDVELSLEEPHRTDVLEEYKADCLAVFGEEIPTTNVSTSDHTRETKATSLLRRYLFIVAAPPCSHGITYVFHIC